MPAIHALDQPDIIKTRVEISGISGFVNIWFITRLDTSTPRQWDQLVRVRINSAWDYGRDRSTFKTEFNLRPRSHKPTIGYFWSLK